MRSIAAVVMAAATLASAQDLLENSPASDWRALVPGSTL
jgi:hypothetical protein